MNAIRLLVACLVALFATPLTAQPYAEVQRTSQYVAVRDGTRLAVNIYRPAQDGRAVETPLPVIFSFTPYRARFTAPDGTINDSALQERQALRALIRAGYVVAVADVRGKGASFGHRRGFQDRIEALDGHDLVEWLARQPFSAGMVGMYGCSYLGGSTFHTASTAPPSLKAAFIGATELDKYAFVRRGGITAQFNTRPDEPLSDDLASVPVDADTDGSMLRAAVAQHAANTPMAGLWYGMPYRDSVSQFTGNAFWEEVAIFRHFDTIRQSGIASYFWSNWRDEPTSHSILSALNLGGRFLAGPGDHCTPPPGIDFNGEVQRFFDFHLKGAANGFDQQPRATYWVEGEGWVRSNQLPGQQAQPLSWYLDGGRSGTARSVNDGTLAAQPGKRGKDRLTVDYQLPDAQYFAFWAQPMDAHGLSYTSAKLGQPLRLVGMPVVRLQASVDRTDAHVWAYLDEVKADGTAEVVSFGRLAFSHRQTAKPSYDTMGLPWSSGHSTDVASVKPGETVELAFEMTAMSRVIPPGHRLRLVITGADPRQRNLADIRQDPPPRITVTRGGARASRIDLPESKLN